MEGDFLLFGEIIATLGVFSYSPQTFILNLILDK